MGSAHRLSHGDIGGCRRLERPTLEERTSSQISTKNPAAYISEGAIDWAFADHLSCRGAKLGDCGGSNTKASDVCDTAKKSQAGGLNTRLDA